MNQILKPDLYYLAHPATTHGDITMNKASALQIQRKLLQDTRATIINPLETVAPDTPWDDAMKYCFRLIDSCSGVILSPFWEFSKGCVAEFFYAAGEKKDIFEIKNDGNIVQLDQKEIFRLKEKLSERILYRQDTDEIVLIEHPKEFQIVYKGRKLTPVSKDSFEDFEEDDSYDDDDSRVNFYKGKADQLLIFINDDVQEAIMYFNKPCANFIKEIIAQFSLRKSFKNFQEGMGLATSLTASIEENPITMVTTVGFNFYLDNKSRLITDSSSKIITIELSFINFQNNKSNKIHRMSLLKDGFVNVFKDKEVLRLYNFLNDNY